MHVHVEPALDRWQLAERESSDRCGLTKTGAPESGDAPFPTLTDTRRLIATGHQPGLWHPGILVKDIAAAEAASRLEAEAFHVVVDQDVMDEFVLELPVREGRMLRVERLVLGKIEPHVATCCQPAIDANRIADRLQDIADQLGPALAADVTPLIEGFRDLPSCPSLARQFTLLLCRLRQPATAVLPMIFASDLARTDLFKDLVQGMLEDAPRCAEAYNQAVATHPEAGIAPLRIEPSRVELPLWALEWEQPRQRVFAQSGDRSPRLTLNAGRPIENENLLLAPRALLLTGFLRQSLCDLFIHGTGGAIYDLAGEQWFAAWRGETLAPMAMVTADLHLTFDVPVADRSELAAAQWWHHHLPHNLDRALELDGDIVDTKRALLKEMDMDQNRVRRRIAFDEIHAINDELGQRYPALLGQAQRRLEDARGGVRNRRVTQKRDWCFALYPTDQLHLLSRRLETAS